MALTRIDNPTPSAPAALADYVQILAVANAAQLQALRGNSHSCIDFTNNFAREGVVFYVGGVLYKAATDQAIGGTPSKYVKITPSGATAAIDYVSSLSGVSWNDAQSGYYDGSGNLYVFDEARAVYDGVVSSGKTIAGQIAYIAGSLSINSNLTVDGNGAIGGTLAVTGVASFVAAISPDGGVTENAVAIKRKVLNIGDWNMDSTASKTVAHGLTTSKIRRIDVWIRHDTASLLIHLTQVYLPGGETVPDGWAAVDTTDISMSRRTGGFFDNVDYNATGFNRGWIFIDYEA